MTEESTINEKGEETIWGLKEKDIITTYNKDSDWYNKKVVIDLIQSLGFYVKELGSDKLHLHNFEPEDIILLERPGHKFKVGDEVRFAKTNPTKYLRLLEGKVIVINPNFTTKSLCYLVFFPNLDSCGISTEKMPWRYDQPWFPKRHATFDVYKQALWCGETGDNRIEFTS